MNGCVRGAIGINASEAAKQDFLSPAIVVSKPPSAVESIIERLRSIFPAVSRIESALDRATGAIPEDCRTGTDHPGTAIGQLEAIVSALEYRIDVAASRIETIF